MNTLLPTAYWPNLHYFWYVINSNRVCVEQFDSYQKQSYRNRTEILSANGKLDLTIPVKKVSGKQFSKDVEIAYSEPWQTKHWRALTSAYKNSPYFEHFEDDIKPFYTTPYPSLLEYNQLQLTCVLRLLKIKTEIINTGDYEKKESEVVDVRDLIHPKKDFRADLLVSERLSIPYYQTFGTKFPFQPNLSILDLLFNEGLGARAYLKTM